MSKASANYNMSFNNGSFKKHKEYNYKYKTNDKKNVLVTTEEGKTQEFTFSEFNMLFSILTL